MISSKKRNFNHLIKRQFKPLIIMVIVLFHFATFSQSSDSTRVPFKYHLQYTGESVRIDQNYRYILEHLVETLEKDTTIHIHIRGHVCCGPGVKISRKRAKNVYRFLKRNGIEPDRITFKGYSNEVPLIFPEKTEEDEARNRRVDFILFKKIKS